MTNPFPLLTLEQSEKVVEYAQKQYVKAFLYALEQGLSENAATTLAIKVYNDGISNYITTKFGVPPSPLVA